LRWLGPWGSAGVPRRIRRDTSACGATKAYVYQPTTSPDGVYLVVPGLHYAGPDDPRLDRFCRVLAAAGMIVVAPFLSDFTRLAVTPAAADDATRAFDAARGIAAARGLSAPAVFSISFGCTPAIEVAARAGDEVGALVLFGGYHDFFACIRYALSARAFDPSGRVLGLPYDPVNAPAVFINLVAHLDVDDEVRFALAGAWLELARRTWGQPELRPHARRMPIAERLAATLRPDLRRLFLIGSGLLPGGPALLEAALARATASFAFAFPGRRLADVRCPVVLAHGRDDDVIPWTETVRLAEDLAGGPPHRVFLTGLYGHTGAALPTPGALARELGTMLDLVYALVDAPRGTLGASLAPR
jgi:pimeloyl-ACP methyl ester carboxylesterase